MEIPTSRPRIFKFLSLDMCLLISVSSANEDIPFNEKNGAKCAAGVPSASLGFVFEELPEFEEDVPVFPLKTRRIVLTRSMNLPGPDERANSIPQCQLAQIIHQTPEMSIRRARKRRAMTISRGRAFRPSRASFVLCALSVLCVDI